MRFNKETGLAAYIYRSAGYFVLVALQIGYGAFWCDKMDTDSLKQWPACAIRLQVGSFFCYKLWDFSFILVVEEPFIWVFRREYRVLAVLVCCCGGN